MFSEKKTCFQTKEEIIMNSFSHCSTPDETYQQLISWGKKLEKIPFSEEKTENLVEGCQSTTYLFYKKKHENLFFFAKSEALISSGTASLLVFLYSGESSQTILSSTPSYFKKLNFSNLLSPLRLQGMFSFYSKIKKISLNELIKSNYP